MQLSGLERYDKRILINISLRSKLRMRNSSTLVHGKGLCIIVNQEGDHFRGSPGIECQQKFETGSRSPYEKSSAFSLAFFDLEDLSAVSPEDLFRFEFVARVAIAIKLDDGKLKGLRFPKDKRLLK